MTRPRRLRWRQHGATYRTSPDPTAAYRQAAVGSRADIHRRRGPANEPASLDIIVTDLNNQNGQRSLLLVNQDDNPANSNA